MDRSKLALAADLRRTICACFLVAFACVGAGCGDDVANDRAEAGDSDASADASEDATLDAECPFGECAFTDAFDVYPGDWTDCKTVDDSFDALELVEGGLAVPAPDKPPGGETMDLWHGIGCAFQDFGVEQGTFGITHTGHGDGQHVEATPLLHIVEDTTSFGFGVWPSKIYGVTPVWLVGVIGKPPTEFAIHYVETGQGMEWESGKHTDLEMVTDGENVKIYWNGVLQKLREFNVEDAPQVDEVPVPEELRGSTKHGLALDAHLAPDRYTPGLTHFWYDPSGEPRP